MLSDCLESIALTTNGKSAPYEVIALFQETSRYSVDRYLAKVAGVRCLHAQLNLGFGGGNNYAAKWAKGRYLVFLNDDAVTRSGWLRALVDAVENDNNIGAVGSRILFPDGTLQEAGAVLWSDGTCYPVGRGAAHGSLAFTYRRAVHYASANGLLVRRDTFERAGGFDERFFPGYYEDVDLCLTIRHTLSQQVVYEPGSVIVHRESATAGRDPNLRAFLFKRHRSLLCRKWPNTLVSYPAPQPESQPATEHAIFIARKNPERVMVIDDRVPSIGLGSGFGRTADLLSELSEAGYAIDFVPTNRRYTPKENPLGVLGVDLVEEPLHEHLARPEKRYDLVIISRPHNFQACYSVVRNVMPSTPVIYDAEALYHRRMFLQARQEADPDRCECALAEAEAMQDYEMEIAQLADAIVAISNTEVEWLESVDKHAPITFMRPLARNVGMLPQKLEERHNAIFVAGWLAGEASPNVPALKWYVEEVLPIIRAWIPDFVTYVSGASPPLSVQCMESDALVLTGFEPSLETLYGSARVAIAPILAGAGVKIKTIETMQYGVPVVATSIGAEGLAVTDGVDIDIADEAPEFAARLAALLSDDTLWLRRREAIAKTVFGWESERITWREVANTVLTSREASNSLTI